MKRQSKLLFMCGLAVVLAACGPSAPDIETATAPSGTEESMPAEMTTEMSVEDHLREMYADFAPDVYFFKAEVDLNGDGEDEVVVHVVSPMLCGTGGCSTLVFQPTSSGYELVTEISVNRPPIRVSQRTSNGWRSLIVAVGGGGVQAHDAELEFDGATYPPNPTVAPVEPAPDTDGAEVLIADFETLTDGTPLWAQ